MRLPEEKWYVVDSKGRLWWGADTQEDAEQFLFPQGYTVVRVNLDLTWDVVHAPG